MPRQPLSRKWSEEDIAKLIELAECGATLTRAASALSRPTASVQKRARALGLQFPGVRAVRAGLRKTGAIER